MRPERFRRVKALAAEALERPSSGRAAFLAETCGDDAELRSEVESLLRAAQAAEGHGFLSEPAVQALAASATLQAVTGKPTPEDDALQARVGRRIGPYRITAAVGHGGMGVVYKAVREEDGKEVAVKLLRGLGDPSLVGARFRAERRILAGLEHDNIARLIDGGSTEEGLPYFTMEYVDGRPITGYCKERALDVPARLRLFRSVCAAVQYAHQRLVIHRDIKPGNILVTAEGVPKLLDFGIATLVQPEDAAGDRPTVTLLPAMTPEYASPEQVRGEPATAATDVYMLGLLLYELLTGRRAQALRTRAPEEVVRVVCDTEPARPSAVAGPDLQRRLSGDLDAIVLKALRKEPGRRYASVQELSEELRRYLESLPVQARGGDRAYRAGRFLRRHRAALTAAALVAASLVGGIVAARRQARRAERRFADVRRLAESFLFEFHDAIRDLPGATPARRLVVAKAREYLDSLAQEAGDDPALLDELATAYLRVGDVQGYPGNPHLGDTAGAAASYGKAVALAERLVALAPGEPGRRATLGRALERQGTIQGQLGDGDAALTTLGRSQGLLEEVRRERPGDRALLHDLHLVHVRQGDLAILRREIDAALGHFEEAQRLDEAGLAASPADASHKRDLAVALSRVAGVVGSRDPARGLALHQRGLALAAELAEAEPESARLRRNLAVAHEKVGKMHAALGDRRAALEHQRRALAIGEELLNADPANEEAARSVAYSLSNVGELLLLVGRPAEALASYRRAHAFYERNASRNPKSFLAAVDLGWSHADVGRVLNRAGDPGAALQHYRRAVDQLASLSASNPSNTDVRAYLAEAYAGRGESELARSAQLRGSGGACPDEARAALRHSADLWAELDRRGVLDADETRRRAEVEGQLAACARAAARAR